ncbi:MAG: 2'-deoxycytidine 5'-triphosphate deaminase [Alphaproteobacteria bacterium]|nr:2'-deoxycytidine 5'-triphosphate deaminase [Alphaproteobacteria bacterium]
MSKSDIALRKAETTNGVLPDSGLKALIASGAIAAASGVDEDQIQPASLDLRLGDVAYRLRASFLPGDHEVANRLDDSLVMHSLDLTRGAVLETGCVYLVPLQEKLRLPKDMSAAANPKSSTGRIDVFVRAVTDRARAFDGMAAGYAGDIYAEISPRTFSVLARTGDRLLQLRVRRGEPRPVRDLTFSLDLHPAADDIVGYRAKRHSRVIDLCGVGAHTVEDFWEPVRAREGRIVLDPGEFYILASKEKIVIPLDEAAEMAPIAPELGEFRAHYAGFFDPGFGVTHTRGKAVLEVRSRDVPFILEDGQPVGRLIFEKLTAPPDVPYGAEGSHSTYQGQGLRLSKYFQSTGQ